MFNSRDSSSGKNRLAASLKAAALIAVLGFIVVAIESPRLVTAPGGPSTVADANARTNGPSADVPETLLPASASEYYFPAQFPAPKGEPEAQPPTF